MYVLARAEGKQCVCVYFSADIFSTRIRRASAPARVHQPGVRITYLRSAANTLKYMSEMGNYRAHTARPQ